MPIVKKPISAIMIDPEVQGRDALVAQNLSIMTEAARAEETFPPIVVDADTFTLIDGKHRIEVYRRLFGDDHIIKVETRTYETRADMLEDSLRLNIGRGCDLSRYDIMQATIKGESVGLSEERIAKVVHWELGRLVKYKSTRLAQTRDGRALMLKRNLRRLAGQRLTKRQEEVNEHSDGMAEMFHANQLIEPLEAGLMPTDNLPLIARLELLAKLIDVFTAELEIDE